ncbi:MAG: hypothetical protein AB7R77_21915 [Ilumatobacteraceae bacterium]
MTIRDEQLTTLYLAHDLGLLGLTPAPRRLHLTRTGHELRITQLVRTRRHDPIIPKGCDTPADPDRVYT